MSITIDERIAYYLAITFILCFCLLVISCSEQKPAGPDAYDNFEYGLSILEQGSLGYTSRHPFTCLPITVFNAIPKIVLFPDVHAEGRWITSPRYAHVLKLFRIPTLLIAVMLCIIVYSWANQLYGNRGAVLALFLMCFSPDMIAHTGEISTDIPAACFILGSSYCFWRFLKHPTATSCVTLGISLGLGLISKFTALLLVPLWICITVYATLCCHPETRPQRAYSLPLLLYALIISVVVLNAAYCFEGIGARLATFRHLFPSDTTRSGISTYARILLPYSYVDGFSARFGMDTTVNPIYLMGKFSTQGWWYFIPIAFLIKTPLSCVILLLICVIFYNRFRKTGPLDDILLLAFPATLVSYFIIFHHPPLSLRYVLPAYPFIWIFMGRLAYPSFSRFRLLYFSALVAALLWYSASSTLIYPYYFGYFNEIIGGPRQGYRYLIDSQLDWGQNWIFLERYEKERGLDIKHKPPFRRGDIIAIESVRLVDDEFKWLRENYEPIECIGYSIFIYDLSKPRIAPKDTGRDSIIYSGTTDTLAD